MRFLSSLLAVLVCLASTTASGSTVLFKSDAQLIAQSERVVHGRVVSQRTTRGGPDARSIYTVTTLAVLEDLTGVSGDTVDVWELGGSIGPETMHVEGGVTFEIGAEVMVCLQRGSVGLQSVGMGLSTFDVRREAAGTSRLLRSLNGVLVVGESTPAADLSLEEFRQLAQQVTGRTAVAGGTPDAAVRRQLPEQAFTYVGDVTPGTAAPGSRWLRAPGVPVLYYANTIPPGFAFDVQAQIQTAMATWTNPADASIVLQYGGIAAAPLADAVFLSFEDPTVPDGVLAVTSITTTDDPTASLHGTVFKRITAATISFQNAAELPTVYQQNGDNYFTRLVAHEVGHTIGLGHTQGDGTITNPIANLMYGLCCYLGITPTPPSIGADDLAGLTFLYPADGACKYFLDPTSVLVSNAGGPLTFRLTTYASCTWTAASNTGFATLISPGSGTGPAPVTFMVAPNSGGPQSGTVTAGGKTSTITLSNLPSLTLDKTSLNFGALTSGATFPLRTSPQIIRLTQGGSGTPTWTAVPSEPWLQVSPASGAGSAVLTISVNPAAALPQSGSVSGSVVVTYTGATTTSGTIVVNLRLIPNGTSAPAFGFVDTPLESAAGLTGAVPFTGWALDDIEIAAVSVCRAAVTGEGTGADPRCGGWAHVYVGDAVFIDGARPDVAVGYPTYPRNTQAGWGLMVLTNMLPGQGNGTYAFSMWARDAEGRSTLLGTRTVTVANATATRPFGTIDTPGQGETIGGSAYVNFGWALTQQPKIIPPDGSTLMVYVDGQAIGQPAYGFYRADIATLFPGLRNSDGAVGYKVLDTRLFSNGLHTIVWTATDSGGMTEGLGSRYFSVSNGSAATRRTDGGTSAVTAAAVEAGTLATMPVTTTTARGRRGWAPDAPWRTYPADAAGRIVVYGEELDRFELQVGGRGAGPVTGYLRVGKALAPLPIGSRLESTTGVFTWAPGVGFVGAYDLVFVRGTDAAPVARQEVRIVLRPKGTGPQVVIDTPVTRQAVGQPFVVAGWAADLMAAEGSGIDTLHVWAYPLTGTAPVFLGVTGAGGHRPDVAAAYGEQFRASGYGLLVQGLEPGTYDLAVFGWSQQRSDFLPASVVRITVR